MMMDLVPCEIADQVAVAIKVVKRHITAIVAIHLYGSAVVGGLKPASDIDLLVTVTEPLNESTRRALMLELLTVSAPPSSDAVKRPLEVTIVLYSEVVPWHYSPKRELQFGEWLRQDIMAGIFEPAMLDHDLAILLTKVRQHSIALVGAEAEVLFEAVPKGDFIKALADTLTLWNSEADWQGDERNIVLTLARIWYSAAIAGCPSTSLT